MSEPRFALFLVGVDFDFDSQLVAIRGLIHRNRQAEQALKDELDQIEAAGKELGGLSDWDERDWIDGVHASVYQGAAHSMAAIGMLAPLIETTLSQAFRGIGSKIYPAKKWGSPNQRWDRLHAIGWNCQAVLTRDGVEDDLAGGTMQLLAVLGLIEKMPTDLAQTLQALFGYRNNMFHNGFEWPAEKCEKFAKRIVNEKWPGNWFSSATRNDVPWIFYMTDTFVEHCLTTWEKVADVLGQFVQENLPREEPPPWMKNISAPDETTK